MRLRPANDGDLLAILGWRNQDTVRKASGSTSEISLSEHRCWFEKALASKEHLIYIVIDGSVETGVVRFERKGDEALISVYLSDERHGRGLGRSAILEGVSKAGKIWDVSRIVACVREDNQRGHNAFERAGFKRVERSMLCADEQRQYVLDVSRVPSRLR